jgi:hypothetical protein
VILQTVARQDPIDRALRRHDRFTTGVTAALILAPAANADPSDDAALGHAICNDLVNERSPNDIVTAIEHARSNLSQEQIQSLISIAVNNYCPDVLPRPLPSSPQSRCPRSP